MYYTFSELKLIRTVLLTSSYFFLCFFKLTIFSLIKLTFLLWRLVFLAFLHPVSDSLTGEDSLLGCDLLSHTSPRSNQSVSALSSSFLPGSGCGSCLEELPPGQVTSGKTSLLQHPSGSRMSAGWLAVKPAQATDLSKNRTASSNKVHIQY